MTDHDLEQTVFLAIARNPPSKQPAAVLKAIRETHVVIERGRWERVRAAAQHENLVVVQTGDLDEG
jgi:hypothetical protein